MLGPLLVVVLAAPGVGVTDFAAEGGASQDLAAGATTVVGQELERLGVFRVVTSQSTRVLLGMERQKQLLGCEDCSSLKFNDLLDLDYVLSGKVLKAGGQYSLFLNLLPSGKTPGKGSSVRVNAPTDAKLLSEAGPATVKLMAAVLTTLQGSLQVTCTEHGAAVKVDDVQVGTTPMPLVKVAGGTHIVSVEKDGFTRSSKETRINSDSTTVEQFILVPSPDTIVAYEARANRTRILAWSALGLAVVGGVFFALGQLEADGLYGSTVNPVQGTFVFDQKQLLAGTQSGTNADGTAVDYRAQATDLKGRIQTWEAVSIAGLAVAGAAAITGAVLLIVGEPPDKYSNFHAGLMVAPGSGGFALSGSF